MSYLSPTTSSLLQSTSKSPCFMFNRNLRSVCSRTDHVHVAVPDQLWKQLQDAQRTRDARSLKDRLIELLRSCACSKHRKASEELLVLRAQSLVGILLSRQASGVPEMMQASTLPIDSVEEAQSGGSQTQKKQHVLDVDDHDVKEKKMRSDAQTASSQGSPTPLPIKHSSMPLTTGGISRELVLEAPDQADEDQRSSSNAGMTVKDPLSKSYQLHQDQQTLLYEEAEKDYSTPSALLGFPFVWPQESIPSLMTIEQGGDWLSNVLEMEGSSM